MKTPFWKLFVFSTFPVIAALGTGLWLSSRIHAKSDSERQKLRTEEVVAQDRLLVDALWSAIETIKTRALSLDQVRQAQLKAGLPASLPDGVILHWAEIESRDGVLRAVRQKVRNPSWNPSPSWESFEQFYLQSALKRLNLRELQENGVAILRLKQDPDRNQEWLAMGFAGSTPSSVILTLVDPAEVFPIFNRWARRSEGGSLRGYLVGSDGFVLAHSQKSYVASDFGATQVFQQGVREMLQGRQASGAGSFKGIDQVPLQVAYARPGTLPLGAVVERVSSQAEPETVLAGVSMVLTQAPADALAAFFWLWALCLGCAWVMKLFLEEDRGGARESVAEPVKAAIVPATLQTDRIKVAQFETQSQKTQDARHVAQHLAETAAQLTGYPSLFFSYHDRLRVAILEAHCGFEENLDGMSFPLNDSLLERITHHEKHGKTASLSDDPGLVLLLSRRVGSSHCDAWPVTGGEGRLLGVLVVLSSGPTPERAHQLVHLDQIMKATGPAYERLTDV